MLELDGVVELDDNVGTVVGDEKDACDVCDRDVQASRHERGEELQPVACVGPGHVVYVDHNDVVGPALGPSIHGGRRA